MGPLVLLGDLRPGRLARIARRAARGLRRRPRPMRRRCATSSSARPTPSRKRRPTTRRGCARSTLHRSGGRRAGRFRGGAGARRRAGRRDRLRQRQPALARRARRGSSACSAASAASARCSSLALRGVSRAAARADAGRGARPRQHADAGDADHRHAALLRDDGGALRRAQRRARHHRRRARARLARAAADEPGRALGAGRRQVGRGGVREHADRGAQLLQLPARPVGAAQRHAGGDVPVRAARGAAVPRRAAAVRGGARRRC